MKVKPQWVKELHGSGHQNTKGNQDTKASSHYNAMYLHTHAHSGVFTVVCTVVFTVGFTVIFTTVFSMLFPLLVSLLLSLPKHQGGSECQSQWSL